MQYCNNIIVPSVHISVNILDNTIILERFSTESIHFGRITGNHKKQDEPK